MIAKTCELSSALRALKPFISSGVPQPIAILYIFIINLYTLVTLSELDHLAKQLAILYVQLTSRCFLP